MKLLLAVTTLILSCTGPKEVRREAKSVKEKEIMDLDRQRIEALEKNDTAFLSKFYSDDFIMITSTGDVRTKSDQLKDIGNGSVQHEKIDEKYFKIRIYGNVAVVNSEATGKVIIDGKESQQIRRFTRVFVKTHQLWRLVSTHISRIP